MKNRPICLPLAATLVVWLAILASFSLAQTPVVEYVDRSSDVGFNYSGQPRNATNVNYNDDAYKDFVITRFAHDASPFSSRSR